MTDLNLDSSASAPLDAARPAKGSERIELLDGLRGFALLGILLANLGYFSGWGFLTDEAKVALAGEWGAAAREFMNLALIDGKFYTIFSLLFGIGFAVQLQRLSDRGIDFGGLYQRRMAGLLLIGLVHMTLIWDGDILTLYALCGFLLLGLRNWPTARLLKFGIALIVLPVPAYALFWLAAWASPGAALEEWAYSVWGYFVGRPVTDSDALSMMRREGVDGYFDWVLSGPLFRWSFILDSWRIPKVVGVFFLGVCAGRQMMAGRLLAGNRLRRICVIGFAVGLPVNLLLAWMGGLPYMDVHLEGLIATFLYTVGVVPLGLAYAAAFALLWERGKRYLGVFSPAGRMALTNYLMQSVVGVAIFYGVGFGLAGHLAPTAWMGIGVAVFAVQLAFSRLWLAWFRFGPMEWVWRCATYGRLMPIRIPASAA